MAVILPDVPSVLRVKVGGLAATAQWVNLFYIQFTAASITQPALDSFVTALGNLWGTAWAPTIQATMKADFVQVWDLSSRTGMNAIDSTDHPGTRATGGTLLPANVSCCVTWGVQDRWRGGHFRTYFVGAGTTDMQSAVAWTSTYQTLINNAATAWRTGINGLTLAGSPVSMVGVRYHGVLPDGSHGMFPSPQVRTILTNRVKSRIDSSRRRLGKELS